MLGCHFLPIYLFAHQFGNFCEYYMIITIRIIVIMNGNISQPALLCTLENVKHAHSFTGKIAHNLVGPSANYPSTPLWACGATPCGGFRPSDSLLPGSEWRVQEIMSIFRLSPRYSKLYVTRSRIT